MNWSLEVIITLVLLIDAIGANIVAWSPGRTWLLEHARSFSRYFPVTKGWALWYLLLVLWTLYVIYRLGGLAL